MIGWHLLITGVMIYGGLQTDTQISFGTWGIKLNLVWLVLPMTVFLILSVVLVFKEVRDPTSVPIFSWGEIDKKVLAAASALFVISFIFFSLGAGFNWFVKLAVFVTIIQWILLVESLGRPKQKEEAMAGNQVT